MNATCKQMQKIPFILKMLSYPRQDGKKANAKLRLI